MSFGQEVKDFIGAFTATSGAMARNSQIDLERQRFQAQNDYLLTRQNYLNSKINGMNTNVPDPATAAGEAARQSYMQGSGKEIGGNAAAQTAFNYFAPIFGKAGAAGIVGNWMQESSFAPDVISGKRLGDKSIPGGSFGIGQWNRERLDQLKAYAAQQGTSPSDFMTQLKFANAELHSSESAVGDALMKAQTPEQAAQIFLGYERPQGYNEYVKSGAKNPGMINGWGNRLSYAQSAFKQYAGSAPTEVANTNTPTANTQSGAVPAPPQQASQPQGGGGDDQFDGKGKAVPLSLAPVVQADTAPAGLDTTVAPPQQGVIPQPPQQTAQQDDQFGYEDDQ